MKERKYVTLVGSRKPPTDKKKHDILLKRVEIIATRLQKDGFICRSGGATFMDQIWESYFPDDQKEIYVIKDGKGYYHNGINVFSLNKMNIKQVEIAQQNAQRIHKKWSALDIFGKQLHTRNYFQVHGHNGILSSELYCFAEPANKTSYTPSGGTRTAWMLAKENNIPCYNLAKFLE